MSLSPPPPGPSAVPVAAPPPPSPPEPIGGRSPAVSPTASDDADRRDDQRSFARTLRAFREYGRHAAAALARRRGDILALPARQQAFLGGAAAVGAVFEQHAASIAANQRFFDAVVAAAGSLFESYWPDELTPAAAAEEPTALDMEKVYSTLRQCVRDWGAEGHAERAAVYGPIAAALVDRFPDPSGRGRVRVLIPGAGLSRLTVVLCGLGFAAQGNEFSYHMLVAGHYLMNGARESAKHELRPFCDATVNVFSRADQHRPVPVPDVSTFDVMAAAEAHCGAPFGELSMVAGDFVEVYSKPAELGAWDAVVTCFFLDTAHNVLEYLEVLHRLLRPGALWVNCGPLLFHFSDAGGEASVDLSLEELCAAADRVGFDLLPGAATVQTAYTNNPRSMRQTVYNCAFFTARRR